MTRTATWLLLPLTATLRSVRAFQIGPKPIPHAKVLGSARGGYDYDDDFEAYDDGRTFHGRHDGGDGATAWASEAHLPEPSATFYSRKELSDPSFSLPAAAADEDGGGSDRRFFRQLCDAAGISRPSRIQSLAWPPLLRGEDAVVSDQTGSGKTLAYLLPLLQRLRRADHGAGGGRQRQRGRTGSPALLILAPTAELADQIHAVCASLGRALTRSDAAWNFRSFVITATGAHSTGIRDQIRRVRSSPVDVLISTPGRLTTILRTKGAGLDLSHVGALVLDEVDFLLVDETFGPQLRAVGAAVHQGADDGDDGSGGRGRRRAQHVFVTATLPEDVLSAIRAEFPTVTQLRGPGLHRIAPAVTQTLVDVSVPAARNRDARACFDVKAQELAKALRGRRCARTLVFCNTVETCRNVENLVE